MTEEMKVWFKPYRRRDGSWMLYINNDRGVSVGDSEDRGLPAPYGKNTSQGQRKLLAALNAALAAAEDYRISMPSSEREKKPDYAAHTEPKAKLQIGDLYITDVAIIGGVSTGSDGAFIALKSGKIIICSSENPVCVAA